jgi:hypothetical protein
MKRPKSVTFVVRSRCYLTEVLHSLILSWKIRIALTHNIRSLRILVTDLQSIIIELSFVGGLKSISLKLRYSTFTVHHAGRSMILQPQLVSYRPVHIMNVGLRVKHLPFCPIITEDGKCGQILVNIPSIKFHKNSVRTDRHFEPNSRVSQFFCECP